MDDRHLLTPDALALELPELPLDPGDVVSGSPTSGLRQLHGMARVDIGVWELTPGVVRDTEVDEVFVVLAGAGSVTFEDGSMIDLRPGAVVRLHAGERTEWTITSTLRKVYVSAT